MMELEIQKELYKRFSDLSFNFFDGFEESKFPYGTFGFFNEISADNKSQDSRTILYQIDLFSNSNGQREIKQMIAELIPKCKESFLIDDIAVHIMSVNSQIITEIDNAEKIYHGVVELTLFY